MAKRPISPEAEQIIRMSRSALSRRRLLQAAGLGGAAVAAAACGAGGGGSGATSAAPTGTGGSTAAPSPSLPEDLSDVEKTVLWSNWISYIDLDEESGANPSLDAFREATGIDVVYTEDINDNKEFFEKVRIQLEQGAPIDRDLVVLTDWMAAYWINNGFVAPLNKDNIPNAVANLEPAYLNVAFDPGRNFSMPWQSGFGALGWNKAAIQEALGTDTLVSVDQLWDPALNGRITVLTEMRDTMGIILASIGYDPSNFTDEQFSEAIAVLQEQVDKGQIRQVTGNSYVQDLKRGDVIAVIGWSGDMFQLGDDFGVALPETGGTLWTDNMLIPVSATHKKNAEAVINYYYEPEVAAEVAAYVQYITPVKGAKEAMQAIDPSLVDNQWIFPDEATLANSYVFMPLTPEQQDRYEREFGAAIGF